MGQNCDSCLFSLFQHYLHTRGTTVYNLTTGRLVHICMPLPFSSLPFSSLADHCWLYSKHIVLLLFCFVNWNYSREKGLEEEKWVFLVCSVLYDSVQLLSCVQLCNPMDCSTPGFPVLHQLLELAQTHVHWVGDAIQPSHPLSSPSPPSYSLSQHQGLFQGVSSSHQVAKVLEFQLQHQSFQWTPRTDLL